MTDAPVTRKSKNPKALKLFPDELIDQLLAHVQGKHAKSIPGESRLAGQLKKQLAERMLAAELSHRLEAFRAICAETFRFAKRPSSAYARASAPPKATLG